MNILSALLLLLSINSISSGKTTKFYKRIGRLLRNRKPFHERHFHNGETDCLEYCLLTKCCRIFNAFKNSSCHFFYHPNGEFEKHSDGSSFITFDRPYNGNEEEVCEKDDAKKEQETTQEKKSTAKPTTSTTPENIAQTTGRTFIKIESCSQYKRFIFASNDFCNVEFKNNQFILNNENCSSPNKFEFSRYKLRDAKGYCYEPDVRNSYQWQQKENCEVTFKCANFGNDGKKALQMHGDPVCMQMNSKNMTRECDSFNYWLAEP